MQQSTSTGQAHHLEPSSLEYAIQNLNTHGHLLDLRRCPSLSDDRLQRINYLLVEKCQRIVTRHAILGRMFEEVIKGTQRRPLYRSHEDQKILHKWKSDFQGKLETPSFPGWNYLDDHNWKILTTAMRYLLTNRLKLVRRFLSISLFFPNPADSVQLPDQQGPQRNRI